MQIHDQSGAARPSRTILVGTPDALRVLSRQLWHLPEEIEVAGCVPVGERIPPGEAIGAAGPVLGPAEDLGAICTAQGVGLAIVTLPAPMGEWTRWIRGELRRVGVSERFVPPMVELLSHAPTPLPSPTGAGRIDYAGLIGRRAHSIDHEAVGRLIRGRRVLITGAGGSIGSELARIVAAHEPDRLVLMERSENALFEIDRQLATRFPGIGRAAVLHDVVERERTAELVGEHAPSVVFHAAAHKHVPLMEDHPAHALANNVFGTASIADASIAAGAERFVLISTDKAVHPSSVMGATKRLAEKYVQGLARGAGASAGLAIVRFGNVLGSAGSVLPIWAAQLGEGEPITVTDERMTRYFMTIPEAAALVVQAGTMTRRGGGARVYVLDMGEPVSILDMARRFVEAHGLTARVRRIGGASVHEGADAFGASVGQIVITGARPGEKLEERLAYDAETLSPSDHPGIGVLSDEEAPTPDEATEMLESLEAARASGDLADVLGAISAHIPSLRRAGSGEPRAVA